MDITINELGQLTPDSYILLDMRGDVEVGHGIIPGAIHMSKEEILEKYSGGLVKADEAEAAEREDSAEKKLIIYCARGRISQELAEELRDRGYDAYSLKGGYTSWLLNEMKNQQADEVCAQVEKSIRKKFRKNIWCKFTKAINQYELVKDLLPNVEYDELSHIIKIEKKDKEHIGKIAICTAGTADIAVAEEAAQTAEYFGSHVDRVFDIGVSGIHRLFSRLEVIQDANCVIAVAGMEGALASVLGGLVDKPVIAVPTSVGYGASMNGLSALLTMINSCANGIAVVNIDNGYGAGYIATQINRLASREYNAK